MAISTQNLSALPSVPVLERILRAYAVLDAILCPEWEYRYHSFDQNWADHQRMGSMRNGQGDHYFMLFNKSGCFCKGFDHESPMSPWWQKDQSLWHGVLDGVPECFHEGLNEPAFDMANTTFCFWRELSDAQWHRANLRFPNGDDPDGSAYLLELLDGRPESYVAWATDYFETDVDQDVVAQILQGARLTTTLIGQLNPEQTPARLQDDLAAIGWPV